MSSTTSTSSKGDKSGGGQSSLKYLFGSQEQQSTESQPPPPPKTVSISLPPYGTDITDPAPAPAPAPQPNFIHPSQGGNILTNRPSTKVKSVPGGQSTLGYLFGDK